MSQNSCTSSSATGEPLVKLIKAISKYSANFCYLHQACIFYFKTVRFAGVHMNVALERYNLLNLQDHVIHRF